MAMLSNEPSSVTMRHKDKNTRKCRENIYGIVIIIIISGPIFEYFAKITMEAVYANNTLKSENN